MQSRPTCSITVAERAARPSRSGSCAGPKSERSERDPVTYVAVIVSSPLRNYTSLRPSLLTSRRFRLLTCGAGGGQCAPQIETTGLLAVSLFAFAFAEPRRRRARPGCALGCSPVSSHIRAESPRCRALPVPSAVAVTMLRSPPTFDSVDACWAHLQTLVGAERIPKLAPVSIQHQKPTRPGGTSYIIYGCKSQAAKVQRCRRRITYRLPHTSEPNAEDPMYVELPCCDPVSLTAFATAYASPRSFGTDRKSTRRTRRPPSRTASPRRPT
jgi:hypothetical protein